MRSGKEGPVTLNASLRTFCSADNFPLLPTRLERVFETDR